jgi:formylglycine-generating enzyme required for sulfatase activity
VDDAVEVVEQSWDEQPPAAEDGAEEVLAEWLIDEPAEPLSEAPPPPAGHVAKEEAELAAVFAEAPTEAAPLIPPAVVSGQVKVPAEVLTGTAPKPSGAVPTLPAAFPIPAVFPVPAVRPRERFVELAIPLDQGPVEAVPMRFAWIPPGDFLMGDNRYDEEKPARRVTISTGFYMCVVTVTQMQWRGIMSYNASRFRGDDRPVEMVSWMECQEFCARLRELTGKRIRLPTEAEWEYACRAGTTTAFFTGDGEEALRRSGWYQGNSGGQTHPVGKLAPSAWGLHDLHGNVWEWCQDWSGPYPAVDETDPKGPETGGGRVVRGGSWRDPAEGCRASSRGQVEPTSRFFEIGCRVCFQPD